MDPLRLLAAASPVLVIAGLVIFLNTSALRLSFWGFLLTAFVANAVFHTSVATIALATLDGFITTVPLVMIVFLGILLATILIGTGALSRIVDAFSGGFRDLTRQTVAMCFGVENLVAGAGIIAEPIIAPALKAVGLPARSAAILSIWGYAGVMSFTLAGAFVLLLSVVSGLSLRKLAVMSAVISVVPALASGFLLPYLAGKQRPNRAHLAFSTFAGLSCGLLVLLFTTCVSSSVACMLAGISVLAGSLLLSRARPRLRTLSIADVAPFLVVIVPLTLVNVYEPLHVLAGKRVVFSLSLLPVHVVTIRPLLDAYTYLALAIALSASVFKIGRKEFGDMMRSATKSAYKAVLAMMIFSAMGQIITFTGYDDALGVISRSNNIPYILAHGLWTLSGSSYPVFAPVLGWMGTFLTGYGSLSIMIFGKLQVELAQFLHVSPEILSSAMMVGSGIGSVSSPFKVAMAASLVGAVGKEGEILKRTIPLGIAISLVAGLWTYMVMLFQ
jgi:lactate permease